MRTRQCAGKEQTLEVEKRFCIVLKMNRTAQQKPMPVHAEVARRSLWDACWEPEEADHTQTTQGTSNYTLVSDVPFLRGPDAEKREAELF